MPATRTATASARCTSTRWRVSGHCSAPGCVRIAASRRKSCQSISASLSSCTTRAGAEKPCSAPLSLPWSGDVLHHPGSRQEPQGFANRRMGRVQLGQRAALYCRVSTADQSCARQERDLTALADRAGYEVVGSFKEVGIFKETGSGVRLDRAERRKVMALAQARRIDAVLVTEL